MKGLLLVPDQDLEANRILQALLNEDYCESDRPAEEQVASK